MMICTKHVKRCSTLRIVGVRRQIQLGSPLGNPSVDRELKNVNRYLMNCQQRWGNPVSVNIEHVRSSFSSVAFARKDKREYEKNNEKRSIFPQLVE